MNSSEVEASVEKLPRVQVGKVQLRDSLKQALKQAADDDVFGLAGELAYRSALAVLPFLLLLAALPSVAASVFSIPDVGDRLAQEADALFSKNLATLVHELITQVAGSNGWTAFFVGLGGTLWGGVSTTSSLRKALNRLYKFDEKSPVIKRKVTELSLTVATGILFALAMMLVLMGPYLLGSLNLVTQLVSLAGAFLIVLAAVVLLFWIVPAAHNSLRWVMPGAILFGLSWVVFSLALSAYLSFSGTLNHVYGSLGAMIALLVWLYGSNLALLIGAELNAVVGNEFDSEVRSESLPRDDKPPAASTHPR